LDSNSNYFQHGNVAASQRDPELNFAGTERKPMGEVRDQEDMMAAAAAGSGGR
jgi:hypothetical protein